MNKKLKQGVAWRGIPLKIISDRHKTHTFNFISERFNNPDDLNAYGFDDVECVVMHSKFNWANISATIGLFPSVGIAKKSGWDIPIDDGFTEAFFSRSDGTPLFVFIMKCGHLKNRHTAPCGVVYFCYDTHIHKQTDGN